MARSQSFHFKFPEVTSQRPSPGQDGHHGWNQLWTACPQMFCAPYHFYCNIIIIAKMTSECPEGVKSSFPIPSLKCLCCEFFKIKIHLIKKTMICTCLYESQVILPPCTPPQRIWEEIRGNQEVRALTCQEQVTSGFRCQLRLCTVLISLGKKMMKTLQNEGHFGSQLPKPE